MKAFIQSVLNKLSSLPSVKFCAVWNGQDGLIDDGYYPATQCPAVFPAFATADITQLGEGVQIYDPLIIDIHILHWQMDDGQGNFDQNLEVFDVVQEVFKNLQKWKTDKSSSFIRIAETQDYSHKGLYHYVIRFQTTLVDDSMQEPVGGSELNAGGEGVTGQASTVSLELDVNTPKEQKVFNFGTMPPPAITDEVDNLVTGEGDEPINIEQ